MSGLGWVAIALTTSIDSKQTRTTPSSTCHDARDFYHTMASLPPDTIQVKRKRGIEAGPIEFLTVERHKRHRSVSGEGVWVYQRKPTVGDLNKNVRGSTLPVIRATEEGEENRPIKALRRKPSRASTTDPSVVNEPKPAEETAKATDDSTASTEQMRRFHLSTPDLSRVGGVLSKKRSAPAVFVERTPKKLKETGDNITSKTTTTPVSEVQAPEPPIPQDEPPFAPPAPANRKFKRPGLRARTKHTKELPKSLVQRDASVDMEQLARDMDAYTLSQISQNIANMEKESAQEAAIRRANKYKPKPPAQRYAERHPEYAAAVAAERERAKAVEAAAASTLKSADEMDIADDTSDDDYVMETYERVPASRLRDGAVPVSRIGLLVFDTEPDMVEFFYGEEGDSDDEFPEDEEDENCELIPFLLPVLLTHYLSKQITNTLFFFALAENYYTADYPDQELANDDMWGRNPYRFVNGNASDQEEFDMMEDDDDFLDSIWEKSRLSESDRKDTY